MEPNRNRVLIVAEDYQFLDTVHGAGAFVVHEWQVANSLDRVTALAVPAPLAIVVDLEVPCFDPLDALKLLGTLRVQSRIVLLAGSDLRKLTNAQRVAATVGLDVAGTLRRPLMLNALSRLLSPHGTASAPIDGEELRRALQADELLLHYQPILTRTGELWSMSGVEALVRWQHPDRGLLYPGQFLRLAENAGLMAELTDFVITAAARQAGAWESAGRELTVAINLAPALVRDSGFVERFMRMLREYDVSPERITLEVIEAASLHDRELVRDVLTRLRMHGVSLSLDDFGTGYSSLTELCRLPFNEIKIDRTLIHDVPGAREASTIVSAIVDLAHRLSMRACAEGVETLEAFEFLKTNGVDSLQGVLFAPPMLPAEVETLAADETSLPALVAAG